MVTVEDGTVVAGANAYISIADADAYHLSRGNVTWTGTDDAKGAAIIRAAQALDGKYRTRYSGTKGSKAQPMAWPRINAEDADGYSFETDEIPANLISANAEAALLELIEPGAMSPQYQRGIRAKTETVDVITESTTYGSEYSGTLTYSVIDQLMADLINAGGPYLVGVLRS